MATNTARAGLIKPAGGEERKIPPLNTNFDTIDKFLGCILVNDGVTPPTGDLFDGAIVKEKTSGIIWEARKNGGGTFDKVYIRYPWNIIAYTLNTAQTSSTTFATWGVNTWSSGKNSSSANLQAGTFAVVIPIKGIYNILWRHRWLPNASGIRAGRLVLNGNAENENTEGSILPNATAYTAVNLPWNREFNAGDAINSEKYQNSGGNLDLYAVAYISLIEPIQ